MITLTSKSRWSLLSLPQWILSPAEAWANVFPPENPEKLAAGKSSFCEAAQEPKTIPKKYE